MAAAYLIIADTVLYCCGRRDHPIGDGRSDGHSEAQSTCAAESSEPVLTLFPVWEKQVFWERIFPGIGKMGKKVVKSPIDHGTVAVHQTRNRPAISILLVSLHPDTEQEHHAPVPAMLQRYVEFGQGPLKNGGGGMKKT